RPARKLFAPTVEDDSQWRGGCQNVCPWKVGWLEKTRGLCRLARTGAGRNRGMARRVGGVARGRRRVAENRRPVVAGSAGRSAAQAGPRIAGRNGRAQRGSVVYWRGAGSAALRRAAAVVTK